jgi:hypothetical protein
MINWHTGFNIQAKRRRKFIWQGRIGEWYAQQCGPQRYMDLRRSHEQRTEVQAGRLLFKVK